VELKDTIAGAVLYTTLLLAIPVAAAEVVIGQMIMVAQVVLV